MGKLVFKIILMILPVLCIIGLFRIILHGGENVAFLPSYEELVLMFSSAPDFFATIPAEVQVVQSAFDNVSFSFGDLGNIEITDIVTFFSAIGRFFESVGVFFEAIGAVFKLIWVAISTPVQFLVWLITKILGFDLAFYTPGTN